MQINIFSPACSLARVATILTHNTPFENTTTAAAVQMKACVRSRWRHMLSAFRRLDPLRTGAVTSDEFRQVSLVFGIIVPFVFHIWSFRVFCIERAALESCQYCRGVVLRKLWLCAMLFSPSIGSTAGLPSCFGYFSIRKDGKGRLNRRKRSTRG